MAEMLDCLVSYFSEDANDEGMLRRYLSYHVVACPGPSPEGGIASITPLAAYDENAVCDTCERVFAVKAAEFERLCKVLAWLLPEEELRPELHVVKGRPPPSSSPPDAPSTE